MFKTAALFASRLSEVERMRIRASTSQDHLDGIFHSFHRYEFDLPLEKALKVFSEVRVNLLEHFVESSKRLTFGNTWKF